ncbi:acetyl-CoA carboxylase biotin carboxyl carrier protein [Paenibacillus senegalensis]|uniref:acetyl-CoA carboxylase biotin carboxyl carrier protein n=1 Tax=Paenibacillus senegalensis TaxID=1465766 RepID=UPI000287F66F|nr:acetyl-CoA carboxylase biotin carboxyl carrier protein [Paenibacillus senegalensis]
MFNLSEIKELIKMVDESTIQELEIKNEGSKLFIRKPGKSETVYVSTPAVQQQPLIASQPAPQAPQEAAAATSAARPDAANLHTIVSPMVGTFYKAPSPEAAPYVQVGSSVQEDTTVCIVEAMKLMNEITAEVTGEIVEVLVENGQLVEFGQPLFKVKPN